MVNEDLSYSVTTLCIYLGNYDRLLLSAPFYFILFSYNSDGENTNTGFKSDGENTNTGFRSDGENANTGFY